MKITTLLAALVLSACADAHDDQSPLDRAILPIFNGAPPDAPEHAAVVGLHRRSGDSVALAPFCSGTLISPTVVLTAAHCLDVAAASKPRPTTISAGAVAIYVGNHAASDPAPQVFGVVEARIHPNYNRFSNNNDIGLLRLAAPVQGVVPVPALPAALGFTQADIGVGVNFAGFGLTEEGASGVKLQVDLPLGGLGCTVPGCPSPGSVDTMVSYSQPGAGPCSGDSGGPLFIYRSGTPYVGAVTSYGDAACTLYGVSARADSAAAVISAFVGVAPPPPPPAGCGDGVCGMGESCDGRNGTVACGDCPGRTGGKASGRYCYVEGACSGAGCP